MGEETDCDNIDITNFLLSFPAHVYLAPRVTYHYSLILLEWGTHFSDMSNDKTLNDYHRQCQLLSSVAIFILFKIYLGEAPIRAQSVCLSGTNPLKPLQASLGNSRILKGTQGYSGVLQGTIGHSRIPWVTQGTLKGIQSTKKALRCLKHPSLKFKSSSKSFQKSLLQTFKRAQSRVLKSA